MVTHQLQVNWRPEKVRRSETDVLPLSHTTNQAKPTDGGSLSCCVLMIVDAGSVEAQFDLGRYRTKEDLVSAIEALPMITTPGNDIAGAMRTLRTQVLAFGYRGYNNYIQKVALTFTDQRARNRRDLMTAFQVHNLVILTHCLTL